MLIYIFKIIKYKNENLKLVQKETYVGRKWSKYFPVIVFAKHWRNGLLGLLTHLPEILPGPMQKPIPNG